MVEITIIDYGVGNIHSINQGLKKAGATTIITRNLEDLENTDGIVLPGVGAFDSAIESLGDSAGMISEAVSTGKYLLGICLGAQLFSDWSEEGGRMKGLGLIPGKIVKLPDKVKTPHMGWNTVIKNKEHPLLSKVSDGNRFYFAHSYHYEPVEEKSIIAKTEYGVSFPSIVGSGSIMGTQFHPEKSGVIGLRILKNFVEMIRLDS